MSCFSKTEAWKILLFEPCGLFHILHRHHCPSKVQSLASLEELVFQLSESSILLSLSQVLSQPTP